MTNTEPSADDAHRVVALFVYMPETLALSIAQRCQEIASRTGVELTPGDLARDVLAREFGP